MSEFSIWENAPAAASAAGADSLLLYQGGTVKQITVSAYEASGGGNATPVNTTATSYALTAAVNGNRTLTVSGTPCVITLPASTGSGVKYRVLLETAATATQTTITASGNSDADVMQGWVHALTTASAGVIGFGTTATSNTVSLNGTTSGGVKGSTWEFEDAVAGTYRVFGVDAPTGTTVTPFSHT